MNAGIYVNCFHYDLLSDLARTVESYLEIGVQEGNSLAAVVLSNKTINVTLCDTWGLAHGGTGRGSHAHIDVMLDTMKHTGLRWYLDGLSAEQLPTLSGKTFDLVHVDGDHSEAGALQDLKLAWLLTKRVMVVHDIFFESVRNAAFMFLDSQRVGPTGGRTMPEAFRIQLSVSDHGSMIIERVKR